MLASVPYRVLGSPGLYALPLLGGLLTLPAAWLLVGMIVPIGRSRRIAQPLAVGIAALGTPMWFYSLTFWEHTPAVCLTTWSILFAARYTKSGHPQEIAFDFASRSPHTQNEIRRLFPYHNRGGVGVTRHYFGHY